MEGASSAVSASETDSYEPVVLVTRGECIPKKYGTKKHPSYETSFRMRSSRTQKLSEPHIIVKFFDDYRELRDQLAKLGVGEGLAVDIKATFPRSYLASSFGVRLQEDTLHERCYLLNKWVQAVFAQFASFPPEAQKAVSDFVSLDEAQKLIGNGDRSVIALLNKTPTRQLDRSQTAKPSSRSTSPAPPLPVRAASAGTLPSSHRPYTPSSPVLPPTVPEEKEDEREERSPPPAFTTSNLTQHNREAPTTRPIVRKNMSVGSSVSIMYTGAELEEYAKETILPPFLAVCVLRGEMIAKHKDDGRLHHSYEAIIRILNYEDCKYSPKDSIDPDAYASISQLPSLSVARVFDGYRQLKDDLQEMGVFCRDSADKARKYNESDTNRRHAVMVDAHFAQTLRRSSLGVKLTDMQLQKRVVQLNLWMGALLKTFPGLPREAQARIMDFFSISEPSAALAVHTSEEYLGGAPPLSSGEVILSMLRGKYTPPLKAQHPVADDKRKSVGILSSFISKKGAKAKDADDAGTPSPVPPTPPSPSLADTSLSPPRSPATPLPPTAEGEEGSELEEVDLEPDTASGTTAVSKAMTPTQLLELGKEGVVHSYIGVRVVAGAKVAKKPHAAAKHPGYEITLRLLPWAEVQVPDKGKLDGAAYEQAITVRGEAYHMSMLRAFDGYRGLKAALEKFGVHCHNDKGMAADSVVIEAAFPRTHRRSSFGLGLTETQMATRQAMLNRYMVALLSKYHLFSPTAQETVNRFLHLDEDNPAEPHNKLLLSMMRRLYRAPPRVVEESKPSVQAGNRSSMDGRGKGKASPGDNFTTTTTSGSYTYGLKKKGAGGEDDGQDGAAGYGRGGGGACCLPGGGCVVS